MSLIKLLDFNWHGDERGSLVSLESHRNIPFEVQRVYYMYQTQLGVTRGYHAHKALKQVLIAIAGSCTITLDDASQKQSVTLTSPKQGLLLESLVWREMSDFSEDCILLVLADSHYDETDYIRDYDEFLNTKN